MFANTSFLISVNMARQIPWPFFSKKDGIVLRACLCNCVCRAVADGVLAVVGALWLAWLLLRLMQLAASRCAIANLLCIAGKNRPPWMPVLNSGAGCCATPPICKERQHAHERPHEACPGVANPQTGSGSSHQKRKTGEGKGAVCPPVLLRQIMVFIRCFVRSA